MTTPKKCLSGNLPFGFMRVCTPMIAPIWKHRQNRTDDSAIYWRKEKVSFRAAYGNERVVAYLFLPRNATPPYATVIYFPGVSSFFEKSSENISPFWVEPVIRSGKAVLYPIYMGTYERRIAFGPVRQTPEEVVQPGSACLSVGPNAARDLVTQWAQDRGHSIDYLETRKDIDAHRLGYYGHSVGAVRGPGPNSGRATPQGQRVGWRRPAV